MAWTNFKGFNFRATLGYVTDGANEKFVTNTFGAYPTATTIDGDTFNCGWDTAAPSHLDRSNTVDRRLAGVGYIFAAGSADPIFRIELPTIGNYDIQLALGDPNVTVLEAARGEIRDTTTALITIPETPIVSGNFFDASGVLRTTAADWVSNQVTVTKNFATTICRIVVVRPATAATASMITHFAIRSAFLKPQSIITQQAVNRASRY